MLFSAKSVQFIKMMIKPLESLLHSVWPDSLKFRHFGKMSEKFFEFNLKVNLVSGKILNLLWQKIMPLGKFLLF